MKCLFDELLPYDIHAPYAKKKTCPLHYGTIKRLPDIMFITIGLIHANSLFCEWQAAQQVDTMAYHEHSITGAICAHAPYKILMPARAADILRVTAMPFIIRRAARARAMLLRY